MKQRQQIKKEEEKEPRKNGLTLSLVITSLITILGWMAGNYLDSERDRKNKLREIKTTYLIDAYRKLAYSAVRTTNYEHFKFDMEAAVADIQLFGTKEQVNELLASIEDMKRHSNLGLDVNRLITLIRNELRKEILLDTINSNVSWVRFNEAGIDSILRIRDSLNPRK